VGHLARPIRFAPEGGAPGRETGLATIPAVAAPVYVR
jgi:hypothetical protein